MEQEQAPMDWTKLAVALCAIIGALFAISRWLGGIIETRVMDRLNDPHDGPLALLDKRMDDMEKRAVRLDTWLEMNKALLATHGGAHHASPFEIDTAWLREKIESSGYVADPAMVEEFKRLAHDPDTPEDDALLWNMIERRFGALALAQEAMKFNAPGDAAPAIWILCLRKAQEIGADNLLQEIGIAV
jgi:hypothetical protein